MKETSPINLQYPKFHKLSKQQFNKIHSASLEILENIGIQFQGAKHALTLFEKAGANLEGELVKIPPSLVQWALDKCPSSITIYNQNKEESMKVKKNKCYYGLGSDCKYLIDHRSGERRSAYKKDIKDGILVADYLDNIDFVMSLLLPQDVDPALQNTRQMQIMLTQTNKPIVFLTQSLSSYYDCIELAEIIAGGKEEFRKKPFAVPYIVIPKPLKHDKECTEKLFFAAKNNIPFIYKPSITMRGSMGPITPAGYHALSNASQLAGIVLAELTNPGAPIIKEGGSGGLDMKTSLPISADPHNSCYAADIGHSYGLPLFGTTGTSSSKVVDEQAVAEAALSILTDSLSGANLMHDVGYLNGALTFSFEHLVICNELIKWTKNFLDPPQRFNNDFYKDIIENFGEMSFARSKVKNLMPDGFHQTELFDHNDYETWLEGGGLSLRERANKKVTEILEVHEAPSLPQQVKKKINQVIKTARQN